MMSYGGGDLTAAGWCCPWPVIGPLRGAMCVQDVGGGLSGLAAQFSDETALEVCIHHTCYALYKSTSLPYFFYFTGRVIKIIACLITVVHIPLQCNVRKKIRQASDSIGR